MGRRVVLVVEADDTLRGRLLDFLAEELGLAVASARDGREAVERAGRFRPDAVLLGTPAESDGAEVARRLRHGRRTGQTWIIGAVPGRALVASCHELLPAPLDLNDLRPAIARALARSGPMSALELAGAPAAASARARRCAGPDPSAPARAGALGRPRPCRGAARRDPFVEPRSRRPTRHP